MEEMDVVAVEIGLPRERGDHRVGVPEELLDGAKDPAYCFQRLAHDTAAGVVDGLGVEREIPLAVPGTKLLEQSPLELFRLQDRFEASLREGRELLLAVEVPLLPVDLLEDRPPDPFDVDTVRLDLEAHAWLATVPGAQAARGSRRR